MLVKSLGYGVVLYVLTYAILFALTLPVIPM
jgi:hypothetical protein